MSTLTIDVGGTNIKIKLAGQAEVRKVPSGPTLTAAQLVADVREAAKDWPYERVSMGYPGVVRNHVIQAEPHNLGPCWVGFDFPAAFGKPVRIVNDAAMQALGSYQGGTMLFLGLGTGLGSTLIVNKVLVPMELGHLPYKKGKTYEEYVGNAAMRAMGRKKWQGVVFDVVERLKRALNAEYVVLGGGNVKRLDALPPDCRPGDNANAFVGGERLWEETHTAPGGNP